VWEYSAEHELASPPASHFTYTDMEDAYISVQIVTISTDITISASQLESPKKYFNPFGSK
jgi:hypothetical protein